MPSGGAARLLLLAALMFVSVSAAEPATDDVDDVMVETESDDNEPTEQVSYSSPVPPVNAHYAEHFDSEPAVDRRWVRSTAKKDDADEAIAKYNGVWSVEPLLRHALSGDRGLVLKSAAKHAAISSKLARPFHFIDKPLVVQYEVIMQNGQTCGGAYLKLLSDSPQLDLAAFRDRTDYSIMFGPDKCGNENKVHFIFRHQNPLTGEFEEKHAKRVTEKLDDVFSDKRPHQYRLVVRPDNSFEIYLDDRVINSGSLLEDMSPPVNPAKEIDDPSDFKPKDWDDHEKIADPDAVKPDDWDDEAPAQIVDMDASKPAGWLDDEPTMLSDPDAVKPDDWDDEMDGEWEAPLVDNPACSGAAGCGEWTRPLIDNPAYRGKWRAPMIANPAYRGSWAPRKIANPDYFEDKQPFKMKSIGAVGFELWTMTDGVYFDNVLVTDSLVDAQRFSDETFALKVKQHGLKESTLVSRFMKYSSERPWLFAVYVLVLGVPVLLVISCCCPSKKTPTATETHKKTDDVQQDDEQTQDDRQEAGDGDEASSSVPMQNDCDTVSTATTSTTTTTDHGDGLDANTDQHQPASQEDSVAASVRTSPRKRRSRVE